MCKLMVTGVMDIIPKTSFPDIRKNRMIQSTQGNLLVIPREKKLVRFYVKLWESSIDQEGTYSLENILQKARSVLSPYTLDFTYCDWWSNYRIGQRLADQYSFHDRIFLAGDAARQFPDLCLDCSVLAYDCLTGL